MIPKTHKGFQRFSFILRKAKGGKGKGEREREGEGREVERGKEREKEEKKQRKEGTNKRTNGGLLLQRKQK